MGVRARHDLVHRRGDAGDLLAHAAGVVDHEREAAHVQQCRERLLVAGHRIGDLLQEVFGGGVRARAGGLVLARRALIRRSLLMPSHVV